MKRGSPSGVGALIGFGALLLGSCQQQWVTPYSADLQKRASDMLVDVTIWEGQMRDAAGTAAADPRHPEVRAKLQQWNSNIEVMATIQLAIEPNSTTCDAFIRAISGAVAKQAKNEETIPVVGGFSNSPSSVDYCESFPDIFERMKKQVSERFPRILDQQCKLPWLSDQYFKALAEARATAGAPSAPRRRKSQDAAAGVPPAGQERLAKDRCSALFDVSIGQPEVPRMHGNLLDPLVVELDAIIYREGRQAPQSAK